MTPEFATALTARFTELTSGLLFDYKPDGSTRAPQIINPMLPRRTGDHNEGEVCPFVRWAVYECEFSPQKPMPFSVIVSAGIWTAGSIDDGNAAILSLAMALGEIVNNRSFSPYRLVTPVRSRIGIPASQDDDANRGLQPHPYYYMTMLLEFLRS